MLLKICLKFCLCYNNHMIKGVIYDLDGTIISSNSLEIRTWDIFLAGYGHKFSEMPENMRSGFAGMKIFAILQAIMAYFKLTNDINVLYKKRTEIFLDLVQSDLGLLDGLVESLQLTRNYNYKVALASTGADQYIKLVLDKCKITDYFDVIITGSNIKIGKPNPEIYLVTAKKLNLATLECLVLADSATSVPAAKSAGCKCIAVLNANIHHKDLYEADGIVNSYNDISIATIKNFK
jgi:HAD superfamily hydrolase (TIGR01549 family)